MKVSSQTIIHECPFAKKTYEIEIYSPLDLVKFLHQNDPSSYEKFVVNIGAADGVTGDPCYAIYKEGWPGLAIEGSDNKALFDNLPQENVKKITNQFCTPFNIAELLRSGGTPTDFSFLKIDIDGYDGPVLQAILGAGFKPAIIQAEVNQEIPFPFEFSVSYSEEYIPVYSGPLGTSHTGFHGMSFAYALRIAQAYGYHFVSASEKYLVDVILLRNDLAGLFGSKIRSDYEGLREIYFEHPAKPPNLTYFRHPDPLMAFSWRSRNDYEVLASELFVKLSEHCRIKHNGKILPFYFSMHPFASMRGLGTSRT
ncbi:FkbM family methyltransferase [Telmatospirillum sp.]|uniref:FkbM family methyltransferase n=1 Tax=Telmatospirillum sp. TaxID=2079197 RepID=UPI00284851C5|nr:FkbM family methyltransferase [Telmatospirillum sp.]MDR3441049.1 hypothetical protein [Telmatospirillum sp.]